MQATSRFIWPLLAGFASLSWANSVTVQVDNLQSAAGQVGCAIFSDAEGFPTEGTPLSQQWHNANTAGVTCQFTDVGIGTFAVSVSHDENSNGEVDTNWLGIPKEAWGVTNNVRPSFRAPTFAEAAFEVTEDTVLTVSVEK